VKIAEGCAKTYLRSITSIWIKTQSDEGKEQLKQKQPMTVVATADLLSVNIAICQNSN